MTKPIRFQGNRLSLNMGTSAAGTIRVELCDLDGKPLPGFSLAQCDLIYGNSLDRTVSWNENEDVSPLAGQPIRIRFAIQEADVYSFVFENRDANEK